MESDPAEPRRPKMKTFMVTLCESGLGRSESRRIEWHVETGGSEAEVRDRQRKLQERFFWLIEEV